MASGTDSAVDLYIAAKNAYATSHRRLASSTEIRPKVPPER